MPKHTLLWGLSSSNHYRLGLWVLAQDEGGPSKGGFLNNYLFSYTDLYFCNEINGVCIQIISYYLYTHAIDFITEI